MAKRKGFYVPLAVDAMDDDRLIDAGPDAELLWYRLLQFVKRTNADGRVSTRQAERYATKKGALPALVRVGMLRPAGEDMWTMAGWFSWNETADEIAEMKAKKSKAGKKGADVRWQTDSTAMAGAIGVAFHANGTTMRLDGTNDNDNDNDNDRPDEVDRSGTSQVLPIRGSAPRRRNGEPQPLSASLAAFGGLGHGGAS